MNQVSTQIDDFLRGAFLKHVPFNRALALTCRNITIGRYEIELPINNELCAGVSPAHEEGVGADVLHGGVISAAMDTACGGAVFSRVGLKRIVTLDLRLDYLKPASASEPLIIVGECHKITRHIAFARGEATTPRGDTVACSAATFFLLGHELLWKGPSTT